MTKKEYKIITDNLGEYSVLRGDGSIVSTEIQNKAGAELFCDELNELLKEIEQLKQDLFEASEELLWATSDEVDRVLYYEDEVEELRKEIFND